MTKDPSDRTGGIGPESFPGLAQMLLIPKEVDMKTQRLLTLCLLGALAMCSPAYARQTRRIEGSRDCPGRHLGGARPVAAPARSLHRRQCRGAVAAAIPRRSTIEIGYIEADIQNVLRTLAAKAGVNLILGDEVTGKVTVNLKGVSYEEAMQLIAESKGYAYVKDKKVVKIKSRESLDVEPVEMRVYTLSYAKADDVKKTLDGIVTKQGKIQVDVRSNTLVLSDTPSSSDQAFPTDRRPRHPDAASADRGEICRNHEEPSEGSGH